MKSMLVEMSSRALAKALKAKTIKSGFATIGTYPINITAMDSKFSPDTTHESERILEREQITQADAIIPGIFSQVRQPPILSLVPNLFLELDMCTPSLVSQGATAENADEIIQSLSQLSLGADSDTPKLSPTHAATNLPRLEYLIFVPYKITFMLHVFQCFNFVTSTTYTMT